MKKTITGLILFVILMGFILLTKVSQVFFDVLILIACAFSTFEMITMARKKGCNPEIFPLAIVILAIYPMIYLFGMKGYLTVAGAGFLLIFGFYIFDQKVSFNDFVFSLFILIYPIMIMSLALLMVREYGMIPFLIAVGGAMCSDTVAYYFGSMIKGPKIFPKISPKKTYAGSIAGLFGGALGTILVYLLFEVANLPINDTIRITDMMSNPILFYSLVGVAIAVVSEIGDLGASRLKRSLDIKDFSQILGSHGGVMDRVDSILFAIILMSIIMAFFV